MLSDHALGGRPVDGGPAPFAVAPNPGTITLGRDGGFASGPDSFEVEFFKVPVNR